MHKGYLISLLAISIIVALLLYGPVPQDENYHDFSDKRSFFGIPNFMDVVSNLFFAVVGLLGLPAAIRLKGKKLQQILSTLFTAFLLLTIGSGYYHLQPNNVTLVYDRIPIGIIISCFLLLLFMTVLMLKQVMFCLPFFPFSVFCLYCTGFIQKEREGVTSGGMPLYSSFQYLPFRLFCGCINHPSSMVGK